MRFREIGNYWNQTETFEALQWYIDLNFDGLRDDVLTLLIHLGYEEQNKYVFIPNAEVQSEYASAVTVS